MSFSNTTESHLNNILGLKCGISTFSVIHKVSLCVYVEGVKKGTKIIIAIS